MMGWLHQHYTFLPTQKEREKLERRREIRLRAESGTIADDVELQDQSVDAYTATANKKCCFASRVP